MAFRCINFNSFPNKPWFLHVYSISFLTYTVYPVRKTLSFSSNLKLSSANFCSLDESKIHRLGKA